MPRFVSRNAAGRLKDPKGASLVETAFLLPLLLLLTFAIMDFATILFVHLALQNGASQATRYGVTGNVMGGFTREASIKQAMRDATPTLTLPDNVFTFSHLNPGGGTWVGGTGGPGTIEKVTVDYTWTLMTPLLRPFFTNGQIHFTVESTMKNESLFQ
jgi:Flp pilus assembly protein TadG